MDQHIMNITLLQSLRSGNIFIDLLIAAMVPMLFNSVWPHIYTVWNYFRRFVKGNIKVGTYRREITYIKSSPFHDYQEEPNSNGLLQHAIRAYIGTQINNDFHSGKIRLTNIQSDKSYDYDDSYQSDSEYEGDGDSDDDNGNGGASSSSSLKSSKQDGFQQLDLPNSDENPVEIIPGLFFSEKMISRSIGNDSESPSNNNNSKTNSNNIEIKYVFISSGYNGRKGSEVIDDFMEVVWNWYIKEVEKKEDHSRWMYQPLVKDLTISSGSKERIYKRYKLTDDKTFKSLFFSEKERVLKLLDTFEKKEGKYSIKGFPHKLGLLLHGPPGTGKTSLVKAIASKMKRHIISIPLSRIRTNQELLDIMLDCSFKYIASSLENGDDGQGKTKRVILPYNKVIFLLEDVDAATAIVRNDEVKNNNNNNIKNNNYNTVPHLSGDSSGEVFDNNNNNYYNPTVTINDNEDDTTTPTERRNEDDNNYNNNNKIQKNVL